MNNDKSELSSRNTEPNLQPNCTHAHLATDRDLLRALMENATDLIYFKDLDSRFIRCSKSMCNRFGTTLEGMIGKSDADFFTDGHATDALRDEQEIIRTGKPLIGKVEKEVWKQGEESWALTAKMPFVDGNGEIIGTMGISKDFTQIKKAEAELEKLHKQLVDTSRLAGMAEVATSVLHNVGNVLNSVNISSNLVLEKIRNSKVVNLAKVSALFESNAADLPGFFANNPKGKQIPGYLAELARHLNAEREEILKELASLSSNIEHIKEVVSMQQNYARVSGVLETFQVSELIEDAVRLNSGAIDRHNLHILREYNPVPAVMVDKHKVLQILVNLIQNAKVAMAQLPVDMERLLTLRTLPCGEDRVQIQVIDKGVGVPPENLTRIFEHGFTTRKTGHGFGLHSGALAAKEMGGSLAVFSEGTGKGATFTLEIPCQPKTQA